MLPIDQALQLKVHEQVANEIAARMRLARTDDRIRKEAVQLTKLLDTLPPSDSTIDAYNKKLFASIPPLCGVDCILILHRDQTISMSASAETDVSIDILEEMIHQLKLRKERDQEWMQKPDSTDPNNC